jgi:hypothetical protein
VSADLSNWFGPYEIKARLFPAFLAMLAPAAVAAAMIGLDYGSASRLLPVLSATGVFFLVAAVTRSLGRRLERSSFAKWGGAPSTQLLRHSDSSVDPVTKARYHAFLSSAIGQDLPSPAVEAHDPGVADKVYESAVLWLRSRTSDTGQFRVLFHENIAYGFSRNGQALRPLAIALSVLAGLWLCLATGIQSPGDVQRASSVVHLLLAVCAASTAIWLGYFREANTKQAGFAYAHALLRTCDSLPAPASRAEPPRILTPR